LLFGSGIVIAWLVACGGGSNLEGDDTTAGDVPEESLDLAEALDVADPFEAAELPADTVDEEGPVPAADFALTDLNPNSPTCGEERRVSEERGKVLVVYFANYT
jgi:hypothetical protein